MRFCTKSIKFATSGFCQRFRECDGISATQASSTKGNHLFILLIFSHEPRFPSLDRKAALLISFAVCPDNMVDERCFLKSCNSPPDGAEPGNNNRSPQMIDTSLIKEARMITENYGVIVLLARTLSVEFV